MTNRAFEAAENRRVGRPRFGNACRFVALAALCSVVAGCKTRLLELPGVSTTAPPPPDLWMGPPDLLGAPPIWPMWGYDRKHQHRTPRIGPALGQLKWKFQTGGSVQWSTPAVGADGTVYIGSADRSLYALDGDSGMKRWSFATDGPISASPAIADDGTVFVRSGDQNVYALDGATGAMKWATPTGKVPTSSGTSSSLTLGPDATLYVVSDVQSTVLYALDSASGLTRWSLALSDGPIRTTPAVADDGTIYCIAFPQSRPGLLKVDRAGAQGWFDAQSGMLASPAIEADGTVLLNSLAGCHAIDAATGAERWLFKHTLSGTPAIAADGTIFLAWDQPPTTHSAVDPASGTAKWTADGFGIEMILDGAGTLYSGGGNEGTVYSYDSRTGARNWFIEVPAPQPGKPVEWVGAPVIGANNLLYIGSNAGTVYAIGP